MVGRYVTMPQNLRARCHVAPENWKSRPDIFRGRNVTYDRSHPACNKLQAIQRSRGMPRKPTALTPEKAKPAGVCTPAGLVERSMPQSD